MKIVKNKHAPPFKTVQFELEFGKGIARESEIIELGCKHKFISRSGAYYSFNGETFHGKDAMKRYFAESEEAREELTMKLRDKLICSETEKKRDSETEFPAGDVQEEVVTSGTTDEEVAVVVG